MNNYTKKEIDDALYIVTNGWYESEYWHKMLDATFDKLTMALAYYHHGEGEVEENDYDVLSFLYMLKTAHKWDELQANTAGE